MSNKLSLMVNFIGVDRLSGSLRNIMQLGRRGSRSLGELRGEGRKLESQLREVRRQMAGASGNVTELVERERQLEAAIASTNRELAERKRLNSIEANRRAMVARGEDLQQRGRDNMTQGAALAAPLILAVKAAGEFSSGMVDIQQKADLTDAATASLAGRIVGMAKDAKRMPEDIRAGLDLLLAKGGDSLGLAAAEKIMGPAGRLATAYKVEVPDAVGAAYASISNLKVPASQTARIFDIMAAAGNAGAFEIKNMARHFPALTAQMQALGEKGAPAVADLSAALQVAMKTAGSEDQAANNIQNLLAKINAPGTIRAFEKNFGVNLPAAMKKLTDEGYSSLEAIAMITQQATGGDMKKLGFAFEDMQARQGLMALMQNLPLYRQIRKDALAATGTVDRAFDQRAANDAMVNWEAFKGSISSLAILVGQKLLPAATAAMNMIIGLADGIGTWAQANPEAAATLTKLFAGLAVFKIGLGAAQFAIGGFMKPLASLISISSRLGLVAKVFTALRTAALFLGSGLMKAGLMMMANPMILAITLLVVAIAGAAYLIYSNWDKIKAAFAQGVAFLTGLGARMAAIGRAIIAGLVNGIRNAGGAVWQTLKKIVLGGIDGVKKLLGIKSPSRVFMAIGQHTGEGMAMGIDRQRGRVAGAAGGLARGAVAAGALAFAPAAMAAQPGGASSGQGAGAAPITIQIYQQPGEDMVELARRVADELRRAQAGAARRSYEDSN